MKIAVIGSRKIKVDIGRYIPQGITLLISEFMRKRRWIHPGDMKLEL